jgi:diacylglycerol kinase (ATP)
MATYTSITVIYNPKSTGSGKELSKDFEEEIHQQLPDLSITIVPTRHPGHAREIAYEASLATKRPLIISASGDGGYNEVINGVMEAQIKKPGILHTTGLLPAGNANDHFQSIYQNDIVSLIKTEKHQKIDILKVSITTANKTRVHYAHSYVGLGLTPHVGIELNKVKLNKISEFFVSAKALMTLRPIRISMDGRTKRYTSLIFSNIDRMAKYLTLSKNASITDGKFEVVAFGSLNRISLLGTLLKASTVGLNSQDHRSNASFIAVHDMKIQLDGEIIALKKNSHVEVTSEHHALSCVV